MGPKAMGVAGVWFVLYQGLQGTWRKEVKYFISILYLSTEGELLGISCIKCYDRYKDSLVYRQDK